jgi:alpha-tubulin suppressor-like RCC1 family protein
MNHLLRPPWLLALACLTLALPGGCGSGGDTDTANTRNDSPAGGGAGQGRTIQAIATGSHQACALFNDGRVKCWGSGPQLGLEEAKNHGDKPGGMGDALPFVNLGIGVRVTAISSGLSTCVLLDNGAVKCWGSNQDGALGRGDDEPVGDQPGEMGDALLAIDLGKGGPITTILSNSDHNCALFREGKLKCWGGNTIGELGLGDTKNRGGQPGEMGDVLPFVDLGTNARVTSIAGGLGHFCALLDSGQIKCWGECGFGQLGLYQPNNLGDEPGEMGDALPTVDLGAGLRATAITTGSDYTCALLDNGGVKCWGFNNNGELGLGDTQDRGNLPGQMGDALPLVDLGTSAKVTSLVAGYNHTCALFDNGKVKCWGLNSSGELGLGDTKNRGESPTQMGAHLPFVDLGTDARVTSIAASASFTCALLDAGQIKCWGNNFGGVLGLGDTSHRGDDPGEMGDKLPFVDLGSP